LTKYTKNIKVTVNMTSPKSGEIEVNFPEGVRRPERDDKYVHTYFTESSHPELVLPARQVHATSYVSERFVHPGALEADGTLSGEIDKARGSNVHYYLGVEVDEKGHAIARATVRKIDIGFGQTFEDLPAYKLAKDTFYPEALDFLKGIPHPQRTLKEISAFGNTPEVKGMAGLEAIRNLLQDGIDSRETWVFTMVEKSFKTLQRFFSPAMMQQIGEPFAIDDPNVSPDIRLVLGMVDTNKFLQQILESHEAETTERTKAFYKEGLLYLTQGLSEREMGEDVAAFVELAKGEGSVDRKDRTKHLGFEGLLRLLKDGPVQWQQPQSFDLSTIADRHEVLRLIDNGAIRSTFDARPQFADELFDLYHSELKSDDGAREEFVNSVVKQGSRYGTQFLMPWSRKLVQFPDRPDYQALRNFRDRPLDSPEEQAIFGAARILDTGLSVGGETAEQHVRAGVGGAVMLADFDTISPTNLNRIRAGVPQIGMRKSDHMGIKLSELDPYIEQVHIGRVTSDAIDRIEAFRPDLIFDAVDDLSAKALLRQIAAKLKVPLVMASDVDRTTIIDVERHDLGETEAFNGALSSEEVALLLSNEMTPQQRLELTAKIIGLENASPQLISWIGDPRFGGLPQRGSTAAKGGSHATDAARLILSDKELASGRYIAPQKDVFGL
jgi:hypothetical protein